MELLGHTDINTTMNIYSHVAAESQRIAADPVEAAKWGVSQSPSLSTLLSIVVVHS